MAHATGDDVKALQLHQQVKDGLVVGLDHNGWVLTRDQVLRWVRIAEAHGCRHHWVKDSQGTWCSRCMAHGQDL